MASSAPFYCSECGAANQRQDTHCFACGLVLACSTDDHPSVTFTSRTLLLQRYQILNMVGKGGFGAVYKALDTSPSQAGKLVAIKQICLGGLSPREMIEATEAFNREVLLLSGLKHPHLPQMYDHFTDPENWYLVMDFIEGQTLETYLHLTRGGQLPFSEVLSIGIQLCTVLAYLHSRQPPIIFRDVKPANIMRTSTGHLYLIDFGIARHFKPGQKKDTTALGSPGYAAPEQYGKAQTTIQTDIYGLGATLHQLLTGEDPADNPFIFTLTSLHTRQQSIPATFTHQLEHMLSMEADKRPASMNDVKHILQQIQDELFPFGLTARPYPQGSGMAYTVPPAQQQTFSGGTTGQVLQPPVARRRISRRTAIISMIGVTELVTIGGGFLFSQFNQRPLPMTGPLPLPSALLTYRGHRGGVYSVAWANGGKRIASASDDGTVQIWDASTGRRLLTYRGHVSWVWDAAWSPDNTFIASCGIDHTVKIWYAVTGDTLLTYRGHTNGVTSVVWSPNGQHIISSGQDETIQLWEVATGTTLFTYYYGADSVVDWSPNGQQFVVGISTGEQAGKVIVWYLSAAYTSPGYMQTYHGHTDSVTAVAWSPDGQLIASGSADRTVQVWNAASLQALFKYTGHNDVVSAVAWSPDGKRIASGGGGNDDTTVQLWDATTGTTVYTYRGHSAPIHSVAWSPDGKYIASASDDQTVQVWSMQ